MIGGVNRVYEHDGREYHIQAEDLGAEQAMFEVRVYDGGAVLWHKRIPYAELLARGLPRLERRRAGPRPPHDLVLRLVATAALVVTLTGLARILGPSLSGLFTPFPVATTVLVVFAHREGGPTGVIAVLEGFIPSLYSFAGFCAALSFGLQRWPVPLAFGAALLVSLASQTVVLLRAGVLSPPTVPARPQSP